MTIERRALERRMRNILGEDISSITVGPGTFYCFIEVPESLKAKYSSLARSLTSHRAETVDHVTVLFLSKAKEEVTPRITEEALAKIQDLMSKCTPMHVKISGWALFDHVKNNNEDATALVALLDCPGLADVHVLLKKTLENELDTTQTHGFTPHMTFAYLPLGTRISKLPILNDEFDIDTLCVATTKIHKVKIGS